MLILLLFISVSYGELLYPYTLLETSVPCANIKDCTQHYNQSWCLSAGVLCIHHYCKLIPDYPCRSTQLCLESEQECLDKECISDQDCNNGIYCDGVEICSHNHCIVDPQRPSCYYTGGRCDEQAQVCYQSKVRLAWQEEQGMMALSDTLPPPPTKDISEMTVSVVSVIVIAAFTGVFFLVIIGVYIARSIRATYIRPRL